MNTNDQIDSTCPDCGSALDPSVLGGSCLPCLLGGVISDEKEELENRDLLPEIQGYHIIEEIGNGGMGVVFRAQQESPAREVAIKVVAPFSLRATEARARFLVEIETMAAVQHPGLLPLFDSGEDSYGRPYLSMQLVDGGTLDERISSYHGDWKKIARLIVELSAAVQYAHERGILHRDLKPANILFDDKDHAYVADFGLAKWTDEDDSLTRSSTMLGSPTYLAPEAAREGSKVTTTVSDVYGLGAILYELLVGAKPYLGDQAAEVLTQILNHPPTAPRQRLSKIPRDLETIVLKAMARSPEKRYHSAAALSDDLDRWIDGKAILARPVGRLERTLNWARRNPALATLSLLLLSSILTGGLLLWKSNQELKASLNDVEDRVEFMTRELPASLAPLGRLDLLDQVFLNVAEHYETNTRDDPTSLARHSDFLTQWSQTLKDRGETDAMIARLSLALAKAEEALTHAGKKPSVKIANARIAAGWRLGEAHLFSGEDHDSIDPENLARAREVLSDTAKFSHNLKYNDDLRYQELLAHLSVELMILETNAGDLPKALAHGESAKTQWQKIRPQLLNEKNSSSTEQALVASTDVHYFLMKAHYAADQPTEADAALSDWVTSRRNLLEAHPANLNFRHRYATARKSMILRGKKSGPEAAKILQEVDEDFSALLIRDPSNIRWLTESVTIAHLLAENAQSQGKKDNHHRWMSTMADRLTPLYKFGNTSYLKLLRIRREDAARCGLYFLPRDWPIAFKHLTGSVETQIRITELDPAPATSARLDRMINRIKDIITQHSGEAAYLEWAKRLKLE